MTRSLRQRFEEKVDKDAPGGCWLWTGANKGKLAPYGILKVSGKLQGAHRISYELYVGPIPEGLEIDHLCRDPRCVNPAHLEPVTARVNSRRSASQSGQNARKTHCLRGHELTPDNVYLIQDSRRCKKCTLARNERWRKGRRT